MEEFLAMDPIKLYDNVQSYRYLLDQESQLMEQIRNPNALILLLSNNQIHFKMLPSLLDLMDSHQPPLKLLGVRLTMKFIQFGEKRSDYGQLLYKSLFPCTTYLDHPELLRNSLELLISLVGYTFRKNTIEFDNMMEEILYAGIMQPFIYCRSSEVQLIFIDAINDLIEPLHILIFKYLQGLMSIACEIVPMMNHCARLSCMKMVRTLHSICYVRFDQYYPALLVAIAEAWRFGSDEELKKELFDFVQIIKREESIQFDLEALVSLDDIYKELIGN
jgi:hypothetical protein